jgi:cyclopropane-fatty-acyl-phospholipid synthase
MSGSVLDQTSFDEHQDRRSATPIRRPPGASPARAWLARWERYWLGCALRAVGDPPLTVHVADGPPIVASSRAAAPVVYLRDRRTLWKLARDPLFEFGEAYSDGSLEVEGDLAELMEVIFRAAHASAAQRGLLARVCGGWRLPRRNTLAGSRDNIHHHYDLGNEFYRLWLDEQLVYTCAYFPQPACTLEEAQFAKMQHVSRKLRLRPGETVLEAGCGWGALALHMARHYGVRVKAFNISREQIAHARERARAEGLAQQVEFIEADWRSMDEPCDAFVSVGMLEHVGPANYRRLGEVIDRCLRPHGRGLLHSIAQTHEQPLNPWIERRIFPGAYPPTLQQIAGVLAPHRFAVLDVENLRLHYARTLWHWRDRFERSAKTVRDQFGERFVRMWRLYLCGSMAAFQCGCLQLFQVLFSRDGNNEIPWTRAHAYEEQAQSPRPQGGQDDGQGKDAVQAAETAHGSL